MLKLLRLNAKLRYYSIKHATNEPIKYTSTINLPKTKFPNRLTATKREELEKKLVASTFANAYSYQELHNKEPTFVLHDGPPYANGDLHMGHAVNKILKDITLRQHVAKGQKVHYIPGWDCHGLPIELKALSDTSDGAKVKEPMLIRNKSRKFAQDAVSKQKDEFRSWGVLSDWNNANNIYLTFSPAFIISQLQLFVDFYERGLVYRDLKPVYWSPSSRTALAEAELEYDPNFISPSVYVRFKLHKSANNTILSSNCNEKTLYALVWTTTPWTLPSNQAICYNAQLDYAIVKLNNGNKDNELYIIATNLLEEFQKTTNLTCEVVETIKGTALKQCHYEHPINSANVKLPFFEAAHVQDTKGTGLVHTAPAHGPEDFLVSLAEKLPVISYVNEHGIYTEDAPEFLRGKEVLAEGDALVLQHIADDVIFADKFSHAYPIDWRTKKPVLIRASEQWFINTEQLKQRAVEEVSAIEMYPRVNAAASKRALMTQVQKRPYWCISRQRAWGVPIPVFYNSKTGAVVTNSKLVSHICAMIAKEGNIDFWWSKTIEELLPAELLQELNVTATSLVKGVDIFDIWFDSGSSWSNVLRNEKVADLYLEGGDQFTGWFQSSLLTSVAARNCAPYKSLFVHGFTVDQKGHKMSKSLGNVISPKDITKKYGVDALRWWVAAHGTQNMSITVSDQLLQQSAENLSKLRATLRYLNGAIGERSATLMPSKQQHSYLNKYILNSLLDFEADIQKHYDSYEYNRVIATIQNFVTNKLSAIYVHLIKDRLYCGDSEEILQIRCALRHCYEILCRAMWPVTPFMVEESWSYYDQTEAFHQQTVNADSNWRTESVSNVVDCALDVKRLLNQKAGDANTWTLDVTVVVKADADLQLLSSLQPELNVAVADSELCEILQVGRVKLARNVDAASSDRFVINVHAQDVVLCPRCRRFAVENVTCICQRCANVLAQDRQQVVKNVA